MKIAPTKKTRKGRHWPLHWEDGNRATIIIIVMKIAPTKITRKGRH